MKVRIILEDDLDAIQGYTTEDKETRVEYMRQQARALDVLLAPNAWGKMTTTFEVEENGVGQGEVIASE